MSNAIPFQLVCQHEVWFKPVHAPNPGDPIYCVRCGTDSQVVDHDYVRGTYYPDSEWYCYKVSNNLSRGVCYRDGKGCGYEYKAPFKRLQSRMDRHHLRGCDKDTVDVKVVSLPPNSPPPF